MTHTIMTEEITERDIDPIVMTRRNQYEKNRDRPKYEQIYREENFRGNLRSCPHLRRQNSREYRCNYRKENFSRDKR